MKTLYFDCFAGASGNMILGGLVSLGVDESELVSRLRALDVSDFEVKFTRVVKSGIAAVHADVQVPHEHVHRHLHTITGIINRSSLSTEVKARACAIFTRLAEAEAKIHGISVEKVHFHEVGAMDAIIDVVGACIGFEMLGIDSFACSKIHVGSGFAQMAHGKFPIPPPAVAELLKGIPVYSTEIVGELCTPTGAAIISTLCTSSGDLPELTTENIGFGAGTRDYQDFPNVIRLMIGESGAASENSQKLIQLETNLDDTTGQVLGFVMERAFELGALDCWFTPIQMKKNRPAVMISVLCEPTKQKVLKELIYTETTTLGIRVREVSRECLERKFVRVSTQFGEIDVKIGVFEGIIVNAMPEFDQLRKAALENGVSLKSVREMVLAKINEQES